MNKNKYMNSLTFTIGKRGRLKYALTLWLSFMLLAPVILFAQSRQITGTVLDAMTGDPLPGVSIKAEDGTNETTTGTDGKFSIAVPANTNLVASYLGYDNQVIQIGSSVDYTIRLEGRASALEEVVVVGFGTQKKVNLTGAVGVATAKDIEERPVMLVTQALQGIVPGLNISQNNGSLESRASINIRGTGTIDGDVSNSPLILIDGMEGDINAINPQDIESISVLKDASAASVYGSRAPFGVILITTKNGVPGKTVVNYNNSFRQNQPILMPKYMDSYTFANYFNDAAINGGDNPHFSAAWLENILAYQNGTLKDATVARNNGRWEEGFDPNGPNNTGGNDNRDYYKEIFRSSAWSQEHNFSMSGGNDKVTFYTALNALDQDGLIRFNQDTYNRYSATAKIGYNAFDWLKVNYSNRFVRDQFKRPSALTESLFQDLGRQAWPTLPLYDPNGYLMQRTALGLRDEGTDKVDTDNMTQQMQFILEPVTGWKTFAEFNYSIRNANRHWDKQVTYMYDIAGDPFVWSNTSNVHEDYLKEDRFGLNLYSEYTHSINDVHNFKGMVGLQFDNMRQTVFGLQRDGILVPGINEIDGTSGTDWNGNPITPGVNGARGRWSTLGYFGRINYDYQGRYLAEFNLRNDGSSRFRSDNRWVWSPSFSLGWNIAQEEFWSPIQHIVNTLKIRGSYGQLANQTTNNWYPTYAAMAVRTSAGDWMQNGVRPNVAWGPNTLVREDLTWEKVKTANFGLDFDVLNYRLTGSFDYFVRKTSDMLGPAPEMPSVLGVGVPKANNTNLTDKGFELQIGWRDRLQNDFGYGVKVMLADYQTVIDKYPNMTGDINTYIPGEQIGQIWGYETIGIAKTQAEMDAHLATLPNGGQDVLGSQWSAGDIMYRDVDGDGRINSGSRTLTDHGDLKVIGNATPRYQFGLELTADWKGFDLRVFLQGVMKRDYWQGNYFFWGARAGGNDGSNNGGGNGTAWQDGGMWWSTGFEPHSDYFRDESTTSVVNGVNSANLDSYYPRPLFSTAKNNYIQSRYLQDASYIRLKNLQVGYTLPSAWTQTIRFEKVRVFFSGENLWTGTKMQKMFDPETIDGGWRGNAYPLSTVISFGLNVNF